MLDLDLDTHSDGERITIEANKEPGHSLNRNINVKIRSSSQVEQNKTVVEFMHQEKGSSATRRNISTLLLRSGSFSSSRFHDATSCPSYNNFTMTCSVSNTLNMINTSAAPKKKR